MATETGTWEVYANGLRALANKEVDLHSNSNLYLMVTSSSHTPNQNSHDFENDLTNVVSGTNLSSAGVALAGTTATVSGGTLTFDATDVSEANVTATGIRNLHIVDKTSGNAATNPLIAYCTLTGDLSPSAGTFSVTFDSSGIFTIDV